MDNKEGASARLWHEKQINQTNSVASGALFYTSKKFSLTKHQIAALKKHIKKEKISWELLINAAFGVLLCRFSSANETLYGIASSQLKGHKNIQLQSSLQAVKSAINPSISVKAYLAKVHKQLTKPKKYDPLKNEIHYLLLMQSKTQGKKSGNAISPSEYPLVATADESKPGEFKIYYHTHHFDKVDIDFIGEHLFLVLTELFECPDKKLKDINLLTKDERTKIFDHWRKPAYNIDFPDLTDCAHDLFTQQANTNPHNVAIFHNEHAITYRELDNAASSLANTLIQHGVKPADHVCVMMERSPALYAAMIAIFKCGAVFVPINPKYPDERVAYVLDDAKPTVVLVNEIEKLPPTCRESGLVIEKSIYHLSDNYSFAPISVKPEAIAYIVYTSGTTGNPKGVMIRHKSLTNLAKWYHGRFGITADDRGSQFASQGFDSFFCETIPFLTCGASVHVVDDSIKLTPHLFLDWLKKSKITICDITTAYAQILFCTAWPENMSLRLMKIGGEALAHYPNQQFSFDIWNTYGPTEATVETTYVKLYTANSPAPFATHKETPPIGKPLIGSEVYVVDKHFNPVPPGIVGELLIGGDIISPGYLNRDEITKQRFINITINGKKTGKLYRTGDLVKWLQDGNLEFIGRIDHQVKIRGYRIELSEIEHAISLHPDVKDVVVVARDGINNQKTLSAYIVPNLDKERFLYQQRCLIAVAKDHFFEAITEDISKEGVSVSGIPDTLSVNSLVNIHIKLPGINESKIFKATVIWIHEHRSGLKFDLSAAEKNLVAKSIDYYLSRHNVMDMILSNSSKRSIKKALQAKMPEYMIPSAFVKMLDFPLNYSGKVDIKSLPSPQSVDDLFRHEYTPAETVTEKKLAQIWSELLNKPEINMSDNFFDLGGSSLTAATLSLRIRDEFNINIPVKLLFDLPFIPILSEYIDTNGEKYSDQSAIQSEIARDSELSDKIQPTTHLSAQIAAPQHILLTGAGGFLGIYLLRELLKQTDAKIYCLIRQGQFESAAIRLQSTIQKFKLEKDISLSNKRIIVIPSDLSQDMFGLTHEHYQSLLEKIDLIHHCGAQVNIMAAYGKLRGSNVLGTLEVIKFATQVKDKPIHYVSTLSSAYCKDEQGLLAECFPTESYEHLFGGYAISKWVSERLLTQIQHRGLPVTIYRSGYIFGQSETGITSLNDALLMLIKGCIQLGYAPAMDEKITILPVDYVSKAITSISLVQQEKSAALHIDHPTGIMWSDLIAWLNDYGYQVKIIPMKEWQHLLGKIGTDNALYPFLPYYIGLKEMEHSPDVNVNKASALLHSLSLPFPEINDKLLSVYFDYLCSAGFLEKPEREKSLEFMSKSEEKL